MSKNNTYYDTHVKELNAQYLAVSTEDVHHSWLSLIQKSGRALDVGTGVGRDAAFLAQQGYSVTAVDASENMLEQAKANFKDLPIEWLVDTLPKLNRVRALDIKYDLILVSAVWQHIAPSQRNDAIRILSRLLAPNGKLVITLRHGDFADSRTAFAVSKDELKDIARKLGLRFSAPAAAELAPDLSGRKDVSWQTVVLTLPDDGTGAFPLIRNIVINDAKAATYKMALIRSVLRIAEGHIGAVVERESTVAKIALPLGLVAMYWLKLFKPLVDNYKMPQNSDPQKGLGFVKDNGWRKIWALSNNDIFIGAIHTKNAKALHSTFLHITSTIKNMPAKYITLPGTKTAVFDVDRKSPKAPKDSLMLDYDYLVSFGLFYVPRDIWNTLSDFSCWIEPALVNEWIRVMQSFKTQGSHSFSLDEYFDALKWEEKTRSTTKVRERIEVMQTQQDVLCTWSKKKLRKSYDIDHAFPFARWPSNDLWNLVPTTKKTNRSKSDKLVTEQRLIHSKDELLDFWMQAWEEEQTLFFSQANLSLPELPINNRQFDDVFEAMLMQRQRIKDTQQLVDF